MSEEIKKEEEQVHDATEEAQEIEKVDNKIKLAALAILNFKKTIAIIFSIALAASIIALAVSGWSWGTVKKDSVELRK